MQQELHESLEPPRIRRRPPTIDAAWATIAVLVPTIVTFLTPTRVFASSWSGPRRNMLAVSRPQPAGPPRPYLANIDGERFLSLAMPIDASVPQLHALVQGSYDEALAPLHALQGRMLLIGIVALAAALLIGISLAAGIIRPVRALVSAMHTVLRGDLRHHAQVDRGDEIGFLARSFNEMVDGLQERTLEQEFFGENVVGGVSALGFTLT